MKLFAAIAATTMMSQASDKMDEVVYKVVISQGDDHFCLTEPQAKKVTTVNDMLETLDETTKRQFGSCPKGTLALDWAKYEVAMKVPWTDAKKLFAFLQTTVIPAQHWEIPKPMTTEFKEMQLQENEEAKTEEKPKPKKIRDIEVPDEIKNFFAFQVDTTPATEAAARDLIAERNDAAGNQVAGQFGSIHLKGAGINDLYLNQEQHGAYFDRDLKVNNPRELIQMIEAANRLDYQDLLDFSSAKLASGIRINDLWRLRAILGFSPTGDYTNKDYIVVGAKDKDGKDKENEKVAGYEDLLLENSWYNPTNDLNAIYRSADTVEDRYLPAAVDGEYTNIENEEAMRKIMNEDYKNGWTEVTDKNNNVICTKNDLIVE